MSGTFPTDVQPTGAQLVSLTPTRVSATQNLTRQARGIGAQRWGWNLTFPPLERADMAPLLAFLVKQRGQWDVFQYKAPPPFETPIGTWQGTPLAPITDAGLTTMDVTGFDPSVAGVIREGDFLTFAGHTKVYLATEDADADGTGTATLVFEPGLMQAILAPEAITTSDVEFRCALAEDSVTFDISTALHFGLALELVEDA